jgi:hypothetical protein
MVPAGEEDDDDEGDAPSAPDVGDLLKLAQKDGANDEQQDAGQEGVIHSSCFREQGAHLLHAAAGLPPNSLTAPSIKKRPPRKG